MNGEYDATVNPAQRDYARTVRGAVRPARSTDPIRQALDDVVRQIGVDARARGEGSTPLRVHIHELQLIVVEDPRALPFVHAARFLGD